jgi:hypothetical protein
MKRASPFPRPDREKLLLAASLTTNEVRLVVANYYAEQEARKRADMQIRHLGDRDPSPVLHLAADAHAEWEALQQQILLHYAKGHPVGRWMLAQVGVGPVIAGGLLGYLATETIPPTAGHWWSFAGLNPEQKWEKGEKRPYNAGLKQIAFHLGECFKRTSNHPASVYGPLYQAQKEKLIARNEAGGFAEKAAVFVLADRAKQKEIRESGKVPPFYLDRMACRWVAKIFISHLHALLYWHTHGAPPPKPYAIVALGHAHEIRIPRTDLFPGFEAAYYGDRKAA